jgi:hypothetical protein
MEDGSLDKVLMLYWRYFVVTTLLILEWHKEERICTWTPSSHSLHLHLRNSLQSGWIYILNRGLFLLAEPYECILG